MRRGNNASNGEASGIPFQTGSAGAPFGEIFSIHWSQEHLKTESYYLIQIKIH